MNKQQIGNIRRADQASTLWGPRRSEIVRLYQTELKSQAAVAGHFGVTLGAIQKVMKRLEIPSRSRANSGARNGRYKDGTKGTAYRAMVTKDLCGRCGSTEALVIHHIDGVHTNNTPSNLEVLCSPCHSSHHKQEWWDARKASRS